MSVFVWLQPSTGSRRMSLAAATLAALAMFLALSDSALAQISWPGGTRSPDEWYYCHSYSTSAWAGYDPFVTPWVCEHMLWQEEPLNPGLYDSLVFEASIGPIQSGSVTLIGYIFPPQGIYQWDYRCDAGVLFVRDADCVGAGCGSGGYYQGAAKATLSGTGSTLSYDSTAWELTKPAVPSAGSSSTATMNVVGHFRSTSTVTDHLWNRSTDAVTGLASNNPLTLNPYFQLYAGTNLSQARSTASYSCQILSWEDLPTYTWLPAPGDIYTPPGGPTPTPSSVFTMTPLLPITNTVDVSIGEPLTTTCNIILAGYTYSGTVVGQSIDIEWAPWEVCAEQRSFDLEMFGFDYGGYLLLAIGMASVGVFWRIIRNG